MPPHTEAKKSDKKPAKKAAGHDANKAAKDIRRAYEHLGRVQSLMALMPGPSQHPIEQLVSAAQQALQSGQPKDAADLLRAGEHYAFGTLKVEDKPENALSHNLYTAITEEYEHLREKAKDHGEAEPAPPSLQVIYEQMVEQAGNAFRAQHYRSALEFARGAEALTHVHERLAGLPAGAGIKQLP